jgi:hypothetical protein
MKPPRTSIATLMFGVLFAAVALAILSHSPGLLTTLAYNVTVVILLLAILKAARRTGPRPDYWLGFAVFGWGHLMLAFPKGTTTPILLTTLVCEWLNTWYLSGYEPARGQFLNALASTNSSYVMQLIFLLITWLLASVGGVVNERFAARQPPETSPDRRAGMHGEETLSEANRVDEPDAAQA